MTEEQPRTRENLLHLEFKDGWIGVDATVYFAPFKRDQVSYIGIREGHIGPSSKVSAPALDIGLCLIASPQTAVSKLSTFIEGLHSAGRMTDNFLIGALPAPFDGIR